MNRIQMLLFYQFLAFVLLTGSLFENSHICMGFAAMICAWATAMAILFNESSDHD